MNEIRLSDAAILLKIDRKTLNNRMVKLGITSRPSTLDGRALVIAESDVQRLAALRGRPALPGGDNADLRRELEELRARIRVLEGGRVSIPALHGVEAPVRALVAAEHADRGLPDGLVSLTAFCDQHGIPVSTVKQAIKRGDLTCHRGSWKVGRARIDYALDASEQAAVLTMYR